MISFKTTGLSEDYKEFRERNKEPHTHRCMKNDRYAKKHWFLWGAVGTDFSYIYGMLDRR